MVMLVRLSKGQSPFTADRNHLHHRLLDNGLKHYQSVLVIYVVQGIYILTAYFMRYQLDQTIVLAFIIISLMAAIIGFIPWQWLLESRSLKSFNNSLLEKVRNFSNKYNNILFCMASDMCRCLCITRIFGVCINKFRCFLVAVSGCSAIGLLFLLFLKSKPCNWIERVAIHVLIVLSIYLGMSYGDQHENYLNNVQVILIASCFVFIVLMLLSRSRQKFSGSPLDFLLVAIALFVPNLPGSPISDPNLSYLALKLIALFYCVEFLLFNLNKQWWVVRIVLILSAGIPVLLNVAS